MNYEVILTERAADELKQTHEWWSENRSVEQAERWYDGFLKRLLTLEVNPERCPFAPENAKLRLQICQINYGLGEKPSHRAIFVIREQ